jgi:hypothetical protein
MININSIAPFPLSMAAPQGAQNLSGGARARARAGGVAGVEFGSLRAALAVSRQELVVPPPDLLDVEPRQALGAALHPFGGHGGDKDKGGSAYRRSGGGSIGGFGFHISSVARLVILAKVGPSHREGFRRR